MPKPIEQEKIKYAPQALKVKEVDRDEHTIRFVMSTPDVDRHGEVIDQRGWDFNNYLQNPVVLWAHDQSIPAIGQVVSLEIVGGNTEGVVKFAYDEHDLAKTVFDLCAGGYIRAVSVGFMNRKWMVDEQEEVITLLENELYELSVVNVPANARALAKSKGINVDVLDTFDQIEQKASAERAKALGVQVKQEEEEAEEGAEATAPDSEEGEETPKDPEPEGADEGGGEGDLTDTEKAIDALEVLMASPNNVIEAAVRELSSVLDAAKTGQPGSTEAGGRKKHSVRGINRLIKRLHKGKSLV